MHVRSTSLRIGFCRDKTLIFVLIHFFNFKLNNVVTLIDEGFDRIGPTLWKACCDHVQKVETRFRQTDIAIDDEIERVVINLADDESDNDDD